MGEHTHVCTHTLHFFEVVHLGVFCVAISLLVAKQQTEMNSLFFRQAVWFWVCVCVCVHKNFVYPVQCFSLILHTCCLWTHIYVNACVQNVLHAVVYICLCVYFKTSKCFNCMSLCHCSLFLCLCLPSNERKPLSEHHSPVISSWSLQTAEIFWLGNKNKYVSIETSVNVHRARTRPPPNPCVLHISVPLLGSLWRGRVGGQRQKKQVLFLISS